MDRISPEGKLQTNRIPVGDLLFHSGVDALKALLADPHWLGSEVGITVTLETWDDCMRFHPHRHCLVTGGGLTPDGKWACRLVTVLWGGNPPAYPTMNAIIVLRK